MSLFTKAEEGYIEHEVQLRLHDHKFQLFEQSLINLDQRLDKLDSKLEASIERMDNKLETSFKHLDNKLDTNLKHLDNKLGWMLGIFISTALIGCLIPVAFHFIKIG